MMTKPITVLIVDDHEVVIQGMRTYLDMQPDITVVGEAATGEEAISLVLSCTPDVILMDLVLPGVDGVETTRRIKKIYPQAKIVVLTSFDQDGHIFPALEAGAISYLLKDMKMPCLAEAVRKAANGETTLHPRVATRVVENVRRERSWENGCYDQLTEREIDVLELVADGHSNCQIAKCLVISENTVKGHVSNILSKLGVDDRTAAVTTALKLGIFTLES
jgi:DNA-binding NarL/FixJ family response regulator